MTTFEVHVDLDGTGRRSLDQLGLTLPAPEWRVSSGDNGVHLRYLVTGLPDWCDPAWEAVVARAADGEEPAIEPDPQLVRRHRQRRKEVAALLRQLLAGNAVGFDPKAPEDLDANARRAGRDVRPWERNAACIRTEYDFGHLLAAADGAAAGWDDTTEDVVDALRGFGYEPGGRYTRDHCWRQDHDSGGQSKGTCIVMAADGSGATCYGHHANVAGPASISAPALLALKEGRSRPQVEGGPLLPVRLWAAATPDADHATAGLFATWHRLDQDVTHGRAAVVAAALRLRYLSIDEPRPLPWENKAAPLYWDADTQMVAHWLPDASRLDISIDRDVRGVDLARQYPGLHVLAVDKDGNPEWGVNKADCKAVMRSHDISRANRNGVVRARCAPVPRFLDGHAGQWTVEHGAPVRILLPSGWSQLAVSRDDARTELAQLLHNLPVPDGMDDADAAALRLCYLLPALTETFPGAQPLVFFTGGTGAGKGITVQSIQACWRHHTSGTLNGVSNPTDVDNRLLDARGGAVWLLDENNGDDSRRSAISPQVMAHLKAVMTAPQHSVRVYHTQRMARLRMNHCWFACARTLSAVSGGEDDWQRRVVSVRFPAATCAQDYKRAMLSDVRRSFDPLRVVALLQVLLAGRTMDYLHEHWAPRWPEAMPGWQMLAGIGSELGMPLSVADFADRVVADTSAVDLFREWWDDTDADTFRNPSDNPGPHAFTRFCQWVQLHRKGRELEKPQRVADALTRQTGNLRRFDVQGGTVSIYEGRPRWYYSADGPPAPRTPRRAEPVVVPAVPAIADAFANRMWGGMPTTVAVAPANGNGNGHHAPAPAIAPGVASVFAGRSWAGLVQPGGNGNGNGHAEPAPALSAFNRAWGGFGAADAAEQPGDPAATAVAPAPTRPVATPARVPAPAATDLRHAVYVDFESACDLDLRKVGAYRYWQHPSAECTCLVATWVDPADQWHVIIWTPTALDPRAYTRDGVADPLALVPERCLQHCGPDPDVSLHHGPECPAALVVAAEGGVPFAAHNCQFDARAWRHMGWPEPVAGWSDTMHATRALLGAAKLEDALQVSFGHGKLEFGTFLPWNSYAGPRRKQLVEYCAADAVPSAALGRDLFARQTDAELQASRLDLVMNDRGIPVDRRLARAIVRVNDAMKTAQIRRVEALTADDPAGQVTQAVLASNPKLAKWLQAHGLTLRATEKGNVSVSGDVLEHARDGREDTGDHEWAPGVSEATRALVVEVINARLETAGIAGAKATAVMVWSGDEGPGVPDDGARIYDQIVHRAASTGRAAGRGVQVQNLPRGHAKVSSADVSAALAILHRLAGGPPPNPGERTFPVYARPQDHAPASVPWSLVAPHDAHAIETHGKSLADLANDGGLSPRELVALLRGCPQSDVDRFTAVAQLQELIRGTGGESE